MIIKLKNPQIEHSHFVITTFLIKYLLSFLQHIILLENTSSTNTNKLCNNHVAYNYVS